MHEALCRPSGTTLAILYAERRGADNSENIGSRGPGYGSLDVTATRRGEGGGTEDPMIGPEIALKRAASATDVAAFPAWELFSEPVISDRGQRSAAFTRLSRC